MTVTEAAQVLNELPDTIRYYVRIAKTLPAMQAPPSDPSKASRSRYKIREHDVIDFAARRGATTEELAQIQAEIDTILQGKRRN